MSTIQTPTTHPMSTVPIMPELVPQLAVFKRPKLAFVLHNAKLKPRDVMFAGNIMTVPAANVVDLQHSDTDADGEPIPGTYVVEDTFAYSTEFKTEIQTLDAARAVSHILGISHTADGTPSELSSAHALSGLSLLPRHASKDIWQKVAAAGEHRAFLAAADQAQYTVDSIDAKNGNRKAAGMAPVSGGAEYEHARFLLQQRDDLVRREMGVPTPGPVSAAVGIHDDAESADAELEFHVFMKGRIQSLVDRVAERQNIDKKALFDELMRDPETRSHAQRAWRFRRKGHEMIPEDELQAKADAGEQLSE